MMEESLAAVMFPSSSFASMYRGTSLPTPKLVPEIVTTPPMVGPEEGEREETVGGK